MHWERLCEAAVAPASGADLKMNFKSSAIHRLRHPKYIHPIVLGTPKYYFSFFARKKKEENNSYDVCGVRTRDVTFELVIAFPVNLIALYTWYVFVWVESPSHFVRSLVHFFSLIIDRLGRLFSLSPLLLKTVLFFIIFI